MNKDIEGDRIAKTIAVIFILVPISGYVIFRLILPFFFAYFGGYVQAANESSAIAALRTLSSAEESFRSALVKDQDQDKVGEYGTLAELSGTESSDGYFFIDSQLGSGEKSGYHFAIQLGEEAYGKASTVDGQEAQYFAVAWPVKYVRDSRRYGQGSHRTFCIDETGVCRARDIGGLRTTREAAISGPDPWELVGG